MKLVSQVVNCDTAEASGAQLRGHADQHHQAHSEGRGPLRPQKRPEPASNRLPGQAPRACLASNPQPQSAPRAVEPVVQFIGMDGYLRPICEDLPACQPANGTVPPAYSSTGRHQPTRRRYRPAESPSRLLRARNFSTRLSGRWLTSRGSAPSATTARLSRVTTILCPRRSPDKDRSLVVESKTGTPIELLLLQQLFDVTRNGILDHCGRCTPDRPKPKTDSRCRRPRCWRAPFASSYGRDSAEHDNNAQTAGLRYESRGQSRGSKRRANPGQLHRAVVYSPWMALASGGEFR